jgi:sporulation protein YlmC with PRC-barrel domain
MVARKFRIVIGGLVCALMLGGLNLAHGQQKKEGRSKGEVRRISTVIGGSVQYAAGGTVGKIEDIVINDEGCIEYIVVAYHDRYVPIPWTVSTVAFDKRIVTINIEQARFDEVPTFSRDEFALLVQVDFREKVHTFYGAGSKGKGTGAKGDKAEKSDEKPKVAEKKTEKATPDPKKSDETTAGDKKPDEKKTAKKTTAEKKAAEKKSDEKTTPEKKSDEKKSGEKKSDEKKDKPGGQ